LRFFRGMRTLILHSLTSLSKKPKEREGNCYIFKVSIGLGMSGVANMIEEMKAWKLSPGLLGR